MHTRLAKKSLSYPGQNRLFASSMNLTASRVSRKLPLYRANSSDASIEQSRYVPIRYSMFYVASASVHHRLQNQSDHYRARIQPGECGPTDRVPTNQSSHPTQANPVLSRLIPKALTTWLAISSMEVSVVSNTGNPAISNILSVTRTSR